MCFNRLKKKNDMLTSQWLHWLAQRECWWYYTILTIQVIFGSNILAIYTALKHNYQMVLHFVQQSGSVINTDTFKLAEEQKIGVTVVSPVTDWQPVQSICLFGEWWDRLMPPQTCTAVIIKWWPCATLGLQNIHEFIKCEWENNAGLPTATQ